MSIPDKPYDDTSTGLFTYLNLSRRISNNHVRDSLWKLSKTAILAHNSRTKSRFMTPFFFEQLITTYNYLAKNRPLPKLKYALVCSIFLLPKIVSAIFLLCEKRGDGTKES